MNVKYLLVWCLSLFHTTVNEISLDFTLLVRKKKSKLKMQTMVKRNYKQFSDNRET